MSFRDAFVSDVETPDPKGLSVVISGGDWESILFDDGAGGGVVLKSRRD